MNEQELNELADELARKIILGEVRSIATGRELVRAALQCVATTTAIRTLEDTIGDADKREAEYRRSDIHTKANSIERFAGELRAKAAALKTGRE